jgi:CBS domain-containing protein
MAIFLGAKGDDILACRSVIAFVNDFRERVAGGMIRLTPEEELALLRGLDGRLAGELEEEERFATAFAGAMEKLAKAPGETALDGAYQRAMELAADYFKLRGSALAANSLCTAFRDALIRRALELSAQRLEEQGFGKPPAPFCWFAFGGLGRREGSFSTDCDMLFVHAKTDRRGTDYFATFSARMAALVKGCGMRETAGIFTADHPWTGGIDQWRSWLTSRERRMQSSRDLAGLASLADLRLVEGEPKLAGEFLDLVHGLLDLHQGAMGKQARAAAAPARTRAAIYSPLPALRDLARNIAELPTGFDFFGRLRVERSGEHRGEFNLELYAITPLVLNVRMLALKHGVAETSTIGRITKVTEAGGLSVELAERLLRAYHDFTRRQLLIQLRDGRRTDGGLFFDPEELSEEESFSFKNGLEALVVVLRIAFQTFEEQG